MWLCFFYALACMIDVPQFSHAVPVVTDANLQLSARVCRETPLATVKSEKRN